MKKNKILAAAAVMLAGLGLSQSATATPAFARQMSMNCMSCHNQSIPMLNSFGRHFKMSGYSMVGGGASMITGGDLGTQVPLAINAGVGAKSTYTSSDATGARSELAIPAGAAIMIGGRIAENAGTNVLINGDGVVHLQAAFTKPMASGTASLAYFGTMGHGPFIATESHNTGLHKELQMLDSSDLTNAAQAMGMGLGKGPASGIVASYGGNGLKVSLGLRSLGFNSTFNNGGLDFDGGFGNLYRITYDTNAIGWDISLGAFGLGGTTGGTTSALFENTGAPFLAAPWAGNVNDHEVTSNGFDMQLQGKIAGMDTQLLLTNVSNYEFVVSNPNNGMKMVNMDKAATSLQGQMMISPAWGLRLGYLSYTDNNASANDMTNTALGVNYNYADNVRFSLERTNVDLDTGSDYAQTLLTTIVAF